MHYERAQELRIKYQQYRGAVRPGRVARQIGPFWFMVPIRAKICPCTCSREKTRLLTFGEIELNPVDSPPDVLQMLKDDIVRLVSHIPNLVRQAHKSYPPIIRPRHRR